ncbi:MAG: hypothetical protein J6J86_01735 [Lachnospiraceae bacterium]|nr:hypothetical protein [Lachnospiraceae bacterium]
MKMIYEIWNLNKKDLLIILGSMAGAWLFGVILVAVIMNIPALEAEDYALIGGFMMLIVWVAVNLFVGAFTLEKQFGMAVSMGRSRKEVILTYWIIYTLNVLLEFFSIILLDKVERVLAAWLYRGVPCGFDLMPYLLDWRLILGILIVVPAVNLFLGMLIMKFQRKAFWGIWAVWMLGSIGLPKLVHFVDENVHHPVAQALNSMIEAVVSLGATGGFLLAAAVGVVLMLIAGMVLRKQPVTYV